MIIVKEFHSEADEIQNIFALKEIFDKYLVTTFVLALLKDQAFLAFKANIEAKI